MPRPRQSEDHELLGRAMQLFWRQGYAGTSLRELETALGLKAPALYNRFGSKDGLFQQALEHYLQGIVSRRVAVYLEAEKPLSGLRRFLETTFDYVRPGQPPLSCLLVNTGIERAGDDAVVDTLLRQGSDMIRAAMAANLQRAVARGELAADADTAGLADHLHLCLQGLLVVSKAEPDPAVLRRKVDRILACLPLVHTE